ncbi:MAG TPA: hypothetical protein VI306_09630 [Pyrinomonadaceae bacterium]
MNDELKKVGQKSKAVVQEAYAKERGSFKTLLLTNPNYFGNLSKSKFQPIFPIVGNTFYEELACIGYQPQDHRLEGVVYVYQPSGYGSDVCGPGSPEYVRFYLSFDSGATWLDQGMTSFQAFNIPEGTEGGKRLEYAVQLKTRLLGNRCSHDPLILVRAILSWHNPPPANQPDWHPVWGNTQERTILVEPRRNLIFADILDTLEVKPTPALQDLVPLDLPIETKTKTLSAVELAANYKDQDVPVHRFAFKEISSFISGKTNLSSETFTKVLPGIEFDPNLVEKLFPTDGDTSYEELTCIGLDPNSPDTLVGIIQVKKSAGYSGGPCTTGSLEYVTFWADFDNNGSFETCLGTASVQVYDVNVPLKGIHYAVRLPVDLNSHRQACRRGPKVVRIRAILSWNSAVPCSNPNRVPTWGNREETLINIAPFGSAPAGKIAILGGIPVSFINNTTGLTTPDAVFATNNLPPDNPDGDLSTADGRPCPFAGRVTVQGAPLLGHSYKVEVTPAGGGAPTAVVTKLMLITLGGTPWEHTADPVTLRFTYVDFSQNIESVLAQWDSTGDDKWIVKLSTFDAGGFFVGQDTHVIQLDNTSPEASIEITSGTGNCGKFTIGQVLSGSFVARDAYLSHYSLGIEPAVNPAGVGVPTPHSGVVNTAIAPGNTWKLDTTGMRSCGYVIRVVASDRAIVNSQSVGHSASDSAGFCLEAPSE